MKQQSVETVCVQGGYTPGNGEPRQIPIIQSTTFRYETSEDMGKLFDLEASGYFYSRLQNPTCDRVAAKITALEGGTAGMLTSSGQAANFFAVFNIAGCGDHVVCSAHIYGGTYNLFHVTMRRMGVDFTFVAPDATEEELEAAFRPNTKAVFGETISNPSLTVLDIELFAKVAHRHGVPLIIDNTFATPVNCRPIEFGADIVTHSTTKYMDGHGSAVGGAVIDSGKFDWTKYPDKFPGLCTPDDSYHGITYTERFGLAGAYITKATAQLMRDFGCTQSPQSAYLLNLGLESLHLRMKQHTANGLAVAKYLQNHPKISWVHYPDLEGDPYHEKQQRYLPNGSCGVVSFGVKGGRAAAETMMKHLKLAAIETHVADARTCCLHPANATHRQMTDEELIAAGVSPDLIRYSCGIEAAEDLIADLEQALAAVKEN
ncbi:MAG: O-acetylhomoserine aminocarboxypropyltransferase/cysteine synthase [Clostridia bacterium]|nr:O-acetylhomoserine aminocarboxypropyltransferase/cysteine synthase [Clostridia bacterium]MDY6184681.1 O-acetylhomoserine aminocarboxypropyltransferase/cysteine synthase family protein [Eubacteriales bacterium]